MANDYRHYWPDSPESTQYGLPMSGEKHIGKSMNGSVKTSALSAVIAIRSRSRKKSRGISPVACAFCRRRPRWIGRQTLLRCAEILILLAAVGVALPTSFYAIQLFEWWDIAAVSAHGFMTLLCSIRLTCSIMCLFLGSFPWPKHHELYKNTR